LVSNVLVRDFASSEEEVSTSSSLWAEDLGHFDKGVVCGYGRNKLGKFRDARKTENFDCDRTSSLAVGYE
jgi:hypothetical protein